MQHSVFFRVLIVVLSVNLLVPSAFAAPRQGTPRTLTAATAVEEERSTADALRDLTKRISAFEKRLKTAAKVKKVKVRRAMEREIKRELKLLQRELKVLQRELRLEARMRAAQKSPVPTPVSPMQTLPPGAARIDELRAEGAGKSGVIPPGLLCAPGLGRDCPWDTTATSTPPIAPTPYPTQSPQPTSVTTPPPAATPPPSTTAPPSSATPTPTPSSTATSTPAVVSPSPTSTPTPTPTPTPVAPSTAPVGFWKFDGSGANEMNQSTGSPNAIAVGSATFNTAGGKWGGYGYIPGSGDSFIIPYSSLFDLPDSFTIEFWFRQRADRSFLQDLVYKGQPMNNYNFRVFRQLWNQYNFGPIITGYTAVRTGYWSQTSNSNQLPHNVWHHVVYTKNTMGSAYYLDGNLTHALDTTQYTEYAGPARTPVLNIIIGDSAVDTDIDNLRIYNYSLTRENVLYNMNTAVSASTATATSPTSTPTPSPSTATSTAPIAPTNFQATFNGNAQANPPTLGYYLSFNYTLATTTKSFNVYTKKPTDTSFVKYTYDAQIPANPSILPLPDGHVPKFYHRGATEWQWWVSVQRPSTELAPGEYKLYVTAVDMNNVESAATATKTLRVLSAPTIVSPASGSTATSTAMMIALQNTDASVTNPTYDIFLYKQNTVYTGWLKNTSATSFAYDGAALTTDGNPYRLVVSASWGGGVLSQHTTSSFTYATSTPP